MFRFSFVFFLSYILSSYCLYGVEIYAHQGESMLAPENTPQSIKLAFDKGAKFAEFDVSITDSGEMVCVHWDEQLKYIWGIDKPVSKLTRQDIENSKLSPKNRFAEEYPDAKLATLDQILAVVPANAYLLVDIKIFNADFPKKFDDAIIKAGLKRSHMYIPVGLLEHFRKISWEYNKAMYSVYLHKPSSEKNLTAEQIIETAKNFKMAKYLKSINIGQAGQGEEFLKRLNDVDFFKKIKAAGFKAGAWTTDDPKLAKKLIDEYGIDILYTNKAAEMKEKLGLTKAN